LVFSISPAYSQELKNKLPRGTVAVRQPNDSVYVGWRLLATDQETVAFNVYRVAGGNKPELANEKPITGSTNFLDPKAPADNSLSYYVAPIVDGQEITETESVSVLSDNYIDIPINTIESYRPGDASIGDLDGDGQLEIILHQSSRGRDNGSAGITGEPILDAYKLDGTHLWRINLGKNIREGEHYTQFMVYDLDGDGCAELACKTADGTTDGTGHVIGDGEKDWRTLREGSQRHGRILEGPEYFTIFDGKTGKELKTVEFIPGRGSINGWGGIGGNAGNDSYGNRCDRFLACVAYLDGERPSVVMCRGVYGRIAMTAWDWREGELTVRWQFDTGSSQPPYKDASPYSGMGGHNLSVADVDNDGKDEIVYQAMVVDDNGEGLYSTGLRHGDVMYISDLDPNRPGLEVFTVQENEDDAELFQTPGAAYRDAATGEILWSHSPAVDVGNGMAADIDPRHPGFEMWGGPGGLRDVNGKTIGRAPRETSWTVWWDGDPLREMVSLGRAPRPRGTRNTRPNNRTTASQEPVGQRRPGAAAAGPREDRDPRDTQAASEAEEARRERFRRRFAARPTTISKWNWEEQTPETIGEIEGVSMSRGPCLLGDLLGDWREEILLVSPDGKSLRLYTTTIPTDLRLTTLLADRQYRLGLVWQNVVYNRPCYPSYFIGVGMPAMRDSESIE